MGPQPPSPPSPRWKERAEQGRPVSALPRASAYFASNQSPGFTSVAIGSPGSRSTDGTGAVPTAISGCSRWGWEGLRGHSGQLRGVGTGGARTAGDSCPRLQFRVARHPGASRLPQAPLERFPLRRKPSWAASAPFDSPAKKTW